jgi:uncharacterized protein (DUF2147 family)
MKRSNGCFRTGLVVLLLMVCAGMARADGGSGLLGGWARDDGGTRMDIVPCGGNYCATNDWVKDPNGKERVGDELVLKLQPVSGSVFQGQAYDVRRKMSYKMTITLQDSTMHTRGCVFLGILCKNADWTRTH